MNSFVAFNDSLEARGIKLVVVPVPDKLQIEAEHYSEELSGGIVAPQYEEWFLRDTVVPGTGNLYHLKYNSYPDYDVRVQKTVDAEGKRYRGSKDAPIVVIGDNNADFGWNSSSNIGAYIAQATGIKTFTRSRIGGGNLGPTLFKDRSEFLDGKKMVVWVFDGRELYGDFSMPEF